MSLISGAALSSENCVFEKRVLHGTASACHSDVCNFTLLQTSKHAPDPQISGLLKPKSVPFEAATEPVSEGGTLRHARLL